MKHWLLKFISCVLSVAIFFSTIEFSQVIAYASGNHPEDWAWDDSEYEAYQESLEISEASIRWNEAHYQDGCPWNFFHNEVQKYIVKKSGELIKMELPIVFKEPVMNPVTEKKSKDGRADLYLRFTDTRSS